MKSTPNAETDLGHRGIPSLDFLHVGNVAQGVCQALKERTQHHGEVLWAGRLWRCAQHLPGTHLHQVKNLPSPEAHTYPEHDDRHAFPDGDTGGADATPGCASSGRRERRPFRVPSLCMAVASLALHALIRYPCRFPVQATRCVFRRCTTAAVPTSPSSGPTSALRAALRSYKVV